MPVHARTWHRFEIDVEPNRRSQNTKNQHGPHDSSEPDPSGAHGGDFTIGGDAPQSEKHAAEHAHGQRVVGDEGNQQEQELAEGGERELPSEHIAQQIANRVAQHEHKTKEPDCREAGSEHAFEDITIEQIHSER